MSVLEGTAALARAGPQVSCFAHPWTAHPSGYPTARDYRPPKQRCSQAVYPPCSQWPLLGLGPSLQGEENGLATGGAEAVMRFQVSEQEGTVCRQAVLALNPLQIVTFRGHCMEAGPRMRRPLHMPLSLQLKVLAVPGPLLSLCLGASPTEDPTGPYPRAYAKAQACKGSARRESREKPCPQGGGGPLPGPRSSS